MSYNETSENESEEDKANQIFKLIISMLKKFIENSMPSITEIIKNLRDIYDFVYLIITGESKDKALEQKFNEIKDKYENQIENLMQEIANLNEEIKRKVEPIEIKPNPLSELLDSFLSKIEDANEVKKLINHIKREVQKEEEYFNLKEMKYLFLISEQKQKIEELQKEIIKQPDYYLKQIDKKDIDKCKLFPHLYSISTTEENNRRFKQSRYKDFQQKCYSPSSIITSNRFPSLSIQESVQRYPKYRNKKLIRTAATIQEMRKLVLSYPTMEIKFPFKLKF